MRNNFNNLGAKIGKIARAVVLSAPLILSSSVSEIPDQGAESNNNNNNKAIPTNPVDNRKINSLEDKNKLNSKISELINVYPYFLLSNIEYIISNLDKELIQKALELIIKDGDYINILDNTDKLKGYITTEQIQKVIKMTISYGNYINILDNTDKLKGYITTEQIQKVIKMTINDRDYRHILDNTDKLKGYITPEQMQKVIEMAISKGRYEYILYNTDKLKDYITPEQIQKVIKTTINDRDYRHILDNTDKLKGYITPEQIQKVIKTTINDRDYRHILDNTDKLKGYITTEQIQKVIEMAISKGRYEYILYNTDKLKYYITPEQMQKVIEMAISKGDYGYILDNTDKLKGYITTEQIQKVIKMAINKEDYWSILIMLYKITEIAPAKDLIYVVSNEIGLRSTIKINNLHNSPDNIRFKSIENKSAEDYIMIISAGREEIYTSSFLYVFNKKLIPELKNNPNIIKNMLDKGVIKNRDILKLINASTFFGDNNGRNGVSNLLMDNLSIVDQNIIIDTIFNDINMKKNPEYAIVLHELLGQNRDNKNLINSIIQKIKENYNKSDIKSKKIYLQLINVILRDKIVDNNLFPSIDRNVLENFSIADISKMDTSILFKNGVNTQRYYFYGDEDGVTSYQNFLSYYKSNKDYKITYNNNQKYIRIDKSVGNKTIRIYANTPEIKNDKESNNSSINNLDQLFESNNITANYIVHRGHSYHVGATIGAINKDTRIIFLGSCGGYNNISSALKNTENTTPIISTTSTGTKYVNDPLLRIINEHILHKDKLTWKQVWEEAGNSIKDNRFSGYVRPDLNKYSVWISTINKVKDTEVPDHID